MPFRFQAKYGLLTYAQCGDLDPFSVSDHLTGLGAECIIGRENHADGGVHLHAFFMFERKFRSRETAIFDVDGHHPNIVAGYSSPQKGYDYATKDGDVVAGGLERPGGRGLSSAMSTWHDVIMAESREEFFRLMSELHPRALITSFGSIRLFADWKYREDPSPYSTPPGITFDTEGYDELNRWASESLGETRVGKCFPPPGPPSLPRSSGGAHGDHAFQISTSRSPTVWFNAD